MRRLAILTVMGLLTACGGNAQKAPSKLAALQTSDCKPIKGIDQILSQTQPEIIIIGEVHGMKEPPDFVKALTCHSLAQGHKTALALEIFDTDNEHKTYLASDGSNAAQEALFDHGMWSGEITDGRSSEAMLKLIDKAREWSQNNGLQVISFQDSNVDYEKYQSVDPETGETKIDLNGYSQAHERGMADNIMTRSAALDVDKVIVLVGNVHARKSNVVFGERKYMAMAGLMPRDRVLTLNAVTHGGSSWNCTGSPMICAESLSQSQINKDSDMFKAEQFTVLMSNGEQTIPNVSIHAFNTDNYDGVVYVGAATASPPANRDGRKPHQPDATE